MSLNASSSIVKTTAMDITNNETKKSKETKPDEMEGTNDATPTYHSLEHDASTAPARDEVAPMEVDLIGVKMIRKPGTGPHFCLSCHLPVRIYGRLVRFFFPLFNYFWEKK